MRRPRRAAVRVLSPQRAPKLGKIRRRACLRLIPFPGIGDVLLAPTMISHPLAYVAPTTRHYMGPTERVFFDLGIWASLGDYAWQHTKSNPQGSHISIAAELFIMQCESTALCSSAPNLSDLNRTTSPSDSELDSLDSKRFRDSLAALLWIQDETHESTYTTS